MDRLNCGLGLGGPFNLERTISGFMFKGQFTGRSRDKFSGRGRLLEIP